MKTDNTSSLFEASRRKFIGKLAATAGIAGIGPSLFAHELPRNSAPSIHTGDAEAWMKKIKGSHRIVYDAPEPHDGFPVVWAWAYYLTNNQTGTEDDDMTAMVVLRHHAIPFALKDELWEKYNLGETFNITDSRTKGPALRNPYYKIEAGDLPIDGIDGIRALQDRGAMFCVCDLALTVYSSFTARAMELNPEEVKKDWEAGVLPDIQIVPSGVWALGRAQENGAGYIYAGG
jgi:intracellular sulfur oxidation DsrE/DsrF family protein